MNNNYIPTFGVEIHAQLKTKTKAFSNSEVNFLSKPNTNINNYDLGYPGTKPIVNKKMVEFGYRLAKVLNMKISETISFDRKNYFYPDLAKGYQITQFFNPIGINGKLTININGIEKDISITEIHIEEDTAKQLKENEITYFDYNRAGTPLIEIVSGHKEFENIDQVIAYVKQMREQLIILDINDGKLSEGSFRVDINVSVRKKIDDPYGVRTEIKNLNSFNNIRKALSSEIIRQINLIESGKKFISSTVKFDEESQMTIPIRKKEILSDYNFIPEYDILPINLSEKIKNEFESYDDFKISDIRKNLSLKYSENNISSLLDNFNLFNLYKNLIKKYDENKIFKILVNNIKQIINESKNDNFNLKIIDKLIYLRLENKIDNTKLNELFKLSLEKNINFEIDELNKKQMMSESEINHLIEKILNDNNDKIKEFQNRLDRIEKFIMGKIMKETRGKANPQVIAKLLKEKF